MRKASRIAFVSWVAVAAMGCAAVTGLDNISESDCAPNCNDAQAKQDVTAQDGPGADTTPGQDVVDHPDTSSGGDDSSQQQDTSTNDVGTQDTSTGDSGPKDAGGKDAPVDTGPDVNPDAPFDSGCGALNTTDNCSACGDKCAQTSSSVTSVACNGPTNGAGAACSYTCATGYVDCDETLNPPDLNGCECHSPGATAANCGSGTTGTPGCCPVQHTDGVSGGSYPTPTFFDCIAAPVGTTGYTTALATDACVQFAGNLANCYAPGECTNQQDAGTGDFVVCGQATATSPCACWEYQGPNVGKVTLATGVNVPDCICPGSSGTGISTFSYN